jgi:hypothetical protein
MPSFRTLLRALSVLGTLAGVVHLLAPDRLLATATWGYDRVLAVDFRPRRPATRRVRLVGLLFLVASLSLRRMLAASREADRVETATPTAHRDSGDSR